MVKGLHNDASPIFSVSPLHALCMTYYFLQFIFRNEFLRGSLFCSSNDKIPDSNSSWSCFDALRTKPTEFELKQLSHQGPVNTISSSNVTPFSALAADLCLVLSKNTEEKRVELTIECPVRLETEWVSYLYLSSTEEIQYAYTASDSLTALSWALRGACHHISRFARAGYTIEIEDEDYGKRTPYNPDVYFHGNMFSTNMELLEKRSKRS